MAAGGSMEDTRVVPSPMGCLLEEEQEETLLHDHFLGVTLDPVLKPPDVVFVGPNSDSVDSSQFVYNSDSSGYHGINFSEFGHEQQQTLIPKQPNTNTYLQGFQGQFEGSSLFDVEEGAGGQSFLESLLAESESIGYANEFVNLVESAQSSSEHTSFTQLKTPMDIVREIQREAEEIEEMSHRSYSPGSGSESGHTATTASPISATELMDEAEADNQSGLEANMITVVVMDDEGQSGRAICSREDHNFTKNPAIKEGRCKKRGHAKKERKKEQNREAATRYRMKKKDEREQIKSELTELEAINDNLKKTVEDKEREVRYIKNLLIEIRNKSR